MTKCQKMYHNISYFEYVVVHVKLQPDNLMDLQSMYTIPPLLNLIALKVQTTKKFEKLKKIFNVCANFSPIRAESGFAQKI